MADETFDKAAAVKLLNQIMESELAGVVRYTHYSLMVFGHNRIPIVSWLRSEANTCLSHASEAGELVTHFGEHPSLKIGALLETHKHGINDILIESLEAERPDSHSTDSYTNSFAIAPCCSKTTRAA